MKCRCHEAHGIAFHVHKARIHYDSGLTLWVNWRAEPWRVEGRVLPQWGFLALGPNTDVSTRLQEGKVADYAECPEYVFADARTWFDLPYVRAKKDIEPRLRSLKDLGANRVRVTFQCPSQSRRCLDRLWQDCDRWRG